MIMNYILSPNFTKLGSHSGQSIGPVFMLNRNRDCAYTYNMHFALPTDIEFTDKDKEKKNEVWSKSIKKIEEKHTNIKSEER